MRPPPSPEDLLIALILFKGRGIASEALRQLVQIAFNEHKLVRLEAYIFPHNIASLRVLQKNGFVLECTCQFAAFKRGKFLSNSILALISEANAKAIAEDRG